jgi:DNA-binding response OmpR family regulator
MKVLIADDDQDLLQLVRFSLSQAGFDTVLAADGAAALRLFDESEPDLVVLDVNMPGMSGFEVCKAIRQSSSVPILILTARSQEEDLVHALSLGADDYVAKPFSPRALVARVRALSRRAQTQTGSATLRAGDVELDVNEQTLTLGKPPPIALTTLETQVFQVLMSAPGRTLSSERLLVQVWGRAENRERQALKQLIHRLRGKLRAHDSGRDLLQTSPGIGYRLNIEL